MKIISWNVNGIRAAWNHGLSAFLDKGDADIYTFQELKTNEPFRIAEKKGYHAFWSFSEQQKGYSGTLCLTRYAPKDVKYGMDDPNFDTEGRIITMWFDDFCLVNCYVPNSKGTKMRYDYRQNWDSHLIQYIGRLMTEKPVVVCGDFNVKLSDADMHDDSREVGDGTSCFLSTERESMKAIMDKGFADAYRLIHPDERGKYTWWSNRLLKRRENKGLRLDYFLVDKRLTHLVDEATMLTDVLGSDHCPILLEIALSDQGEVEPVPPRLQAKCTYHDLASIKNLKELKIAIFDMRGMDLGGVWESVDWEQAESHLAHMQKRLAIAASKKNKKMMGLYRDCIVKSLDAKLLAVRHTCDSNAQEGYDHVRWVTPHDKMNAAFMLTSDGYVASPSRLVIVKTKNGKERRIHLDTYHDRAMQCLYAFALDPIAEAWGDRNSYAYRKGRSAFDMNENIKKQLSGLDAPRWVFKADVRKCYETISHEWLLDNIPLPRGVLYQFLKAGYIYGGKRYDTEMGVGIGCSISPIVANMTLDGLSAFVQNRLYPNGEIDYLDCHMERFADDIVFFTRTEATARKIRDLTIEFLAERHLMLSPDKCEIRNIDEEFTFLSRTYYRIGTKMFARPSEASIERFTTSVFDTIDNYSGSQKTLIETLNRKIDGWTSFHRTDESEKVFARLDAIISGLLMNLCERKHPKWTREKILAKYWFTDGRGRHCYALADKKEVRLKFLADTPPIRHSQVWSLANPYVDTAYMEKRTNERQIQNITGVYRSIWERQGGKCHYCGRELLREERKVLVEEFPACSRYAARMVYVHERCQHGSLEYIDTAELPFSIEDANEMLTQLEGARKRKDLRLQVLKEYFRFLCMDSVTLTFGEIEDIIGESLGESSKHNSFWTRTGFDNLSQCWLENGYRIKHLDISGKTVAFEKESLRRNYEKLHIPEVIRRGQIPEEAKYELSNFFKYIIRKYGL